MSETIKAVLFSVFIAAGTGVFSYYLLECKNKQTATAKGDKNAVGYSIAYSLLAFVVSFGLLMLFFKAKPQAQKAYALWRTPTKAGAAKIE